MTKEINFKKGKVTHSRGRNGNILTTGVELFSYGTTVDIYPITSRGNGSPACRISVPKESVPELINILKEYL